MAVKQTEAKIIAETLLKKIDFARGESNTHTGRFSALGEISSSQSDYRVQLL